MDQQVDDSGGGVPIQPSRHVREEQGEGEKIKEQQQQQQQQENKTAADPASSDSIKQSTAQQQQQQQGEESSAYNAERGEWNGPKGPEPTRYNDWERKGRAIDF